MKRWHEVNRIFQLALELAGEPREDYLRTACAEDPELDRAVRALLAADESAGRFLDEPLVRPATELASSEPANLPRDRRIGPYRLLRRIGQGGMSTVYLAERDDEFQRRVAVKLIRQDMESAESERRLRAERKILAHLDHPYIARLFDGGTTADGLPFFVMEHVEGVRIDRYCDQQQMRVRQRLELFEKILEAVHYAHQSLIVHRDLKPSNILVTGDGTPKLLDFGIAKILNAELADRESEPTATWMRVLTPSYASPEQIRGTPITTASDVYSLGVLLFKLLAGSLPYHLAGRTMQEVEEELTASEPPKPSSVLGRESADSLATIARQRRTTGEQLRQQLAGDLDAVIVKAMQPAPRRRYGSVEQLSQDLRRYLEGFPVAAAPDTLAYRAGKFLRRHRRAVAGGALLAAAAALLVGLLAAQNVRIARQRDRVVQQQEATARVLAFTERILTLADPAIARGVEWTVAEALTQSGGLIEKELAAEPAIRSRLHGTIGRIFLGLGKPEAAAAHLEQALGVQRQVGGSASVETADALRDLAAARVAEGDFAAAQALAAEAVELYRRLTGLEDSGSVPAFNTFVLAQCATGDFAAADAASAEALELARRLRGGRDLETARALHNRALVLNQRGDHEGAAAFYGEVLEIRRAVLGEPHPDVASTLGNLAATLFKQDKLAEAERYYHLALAQQRLLLGEDHPDLAPTLNNLAALHRRNGRWAEAEAAYRQALALFPEDHVQRLRLHTELASLLLAAGRGEESEALLRRELERWRPQLPPGNTLIAWAESALGETLAEQGLFEEAETLLTRSLPLIRERRGPRDAYTQKATRRLVRLYEAQGLADRAAWYRNQLDEP